MSLFTQLLGEYTLDRSVIDLKLKQQHKMQGSALFTPCEDTKTLLYREDITINNQYTAYRTFKYVITDQNIKIFFSDGHREGLYVCLQFNTPAMDAEDIHYCGQDTYKHKMAINGFNQFTTNITICGPQKDCVIKTTYLKRGHS